MTDPQGQPRNHAPDIDKGSSMLEENQSARDAWSQCEGA